MRTCDPVQCWPHNQKHRKPEQPCASPASTRLQIALITKNYPDQNPKDRKTFVAHGAIRSAKKAKNAALADQRLLLNAGEEFSGLLAARVERRRRRPVRDFCDIRRAI